MLLNIAQHNLFLLFSKFSQERCVSLEPYINLWGKSQVKLHHERLLKSHTHSSSINVPYKLYPVPQKPNYWETISSEMPRKRHVLCPADSLLMKSRTQCRWSLFSPTSYSSKLFCSFTVSNLQCVNLLENMEKSRQYSYNMRPTTAAKPKNARLKH